MTGFIKKVKPGVTSQQLASVEKKIVSTTPSPQPIPSSGSGGFVTPLVSQPAQPGDPSFVGPVQLEPVPVQPTFVGPVKIEPTPIPVTSVPQPGDPSFVGPVRDPISPSIPEWYSQQVTVPESIKFLSLEKEYIRYGYETSIGYTPTSNLVSLLKKRIKERKGITHKEIKKIQRIPFDIIAERKFGQLQPLKKFEYGLQFGGIKDEPVSKWKQYEGGSEYLSRLSKEQKEFKLQEFLGTEEWKQYISSTRGKQQLEVTRESIAREGLGPFDLVVMSTVSDYEAKLKLAQQRLFGKPETFEKRVWEGLDIQTRYKRLYQEGLVGAGLFVPTIVEKGISLGFGTPTPIGKFQQEQFVSTPSLFEAPFSEEARSRITSDPGRLSESVFRTGATFIGFKAGTGIISKAVGGAKKAISFSYKSSYQFLPQSLKHTIGKVSEFKTYGIARKAAFRQRIQMKYFRPVQEKVSSIKFGYRQLPPVKKVGQFKEYFSTHIDVFKSRVSYKFSPVKQKITDLYPKHQLRNIGRSIERRIPRLPSYETELVKRLKPSAQSTLKSYAKSPVEGTGLKGTKPFIKSPITKTKTTISKDFLKDWKLTKQDITRYENINKAARESFKDLKHTMPKVKTYKQITITTKTKPSIFLDKDISFYKDGIRGFKGFKPPVHKPMSIQNLYKKMSKEAKETFLSRKPTHIQTGFRIEPTAKTKYFLSADKGKLVVDKLEMASPTFKPSTPLKFPKVKTTIKDIVKYDTSKPVVTVTDVGLTRGFVPQTIGQSKVIGGFRMPSGYAIATGGVSLGFLEFLEEGTQQVSPYWERKTIPKPLSLYGFDRALKSDMKFDALKISKLKSKTDVVFRPRTKTKLDKDTIVSTASKQTPAVIQNYQQRSAQLQKQLQKQKYKTYQPTPAIPKDVYKAPKVPIPVIPLLDDSGIKKVRRRKKIKPYDIGYRFREWKTLTMKEFLGGKG